MNLIVVSSFILLQYFTALSFTEAISVMHVPRTEYVDLSYTFGKDTLFYPGQRKLSISKDYDGVNKSGVWYSAFSFCMGEHGGTHMDAPYHFNKDGWTVEKIPPSHLLDVPVSVINVENYVKNLTIPDEFTLKVEHLVEHERSSMKLPFGGVLMVYTGWSKYWPNAEKYIGPTDPENPENTVTSFPGLSLEAAQWLADERQIVGVGIDTPSIDVGYSKDYPVHVLFGKKQIYNLENVANLHLLIEKQQTEKNSCDLRLLVLPLNMIGATGSPTRLLAHCKKCTQLD